MFGIILLLGNPEIPIHYTSWSQVEQALLPYKFTYFIMVKNICTDSRNIEHGQISLNGHKIAKNCEFRAIFGFFLACLSLKLFPLFPKAFLDSSCAYKSISSLSSYTKVPLVGTLNLCQEMPDTSLEDPQVALVAI